MNITKQQRNAERLPGESRRQRAAELRLRAAAVREDLDEQERALRELRDADEAGELEAQACELELEQERIDKSADLRERAERAVVAAAELSAQVADLDTQILQAATRAARFTAQQTGELAERRRELQQRGADAADAGDTEALLETERDIALLPAVEERLREQADAATLRASELNKRAAHLEALAAQRRANAAALRRRADTNPLAALDDPQYVADEQLELHGGRREPEYLLGRTAALSSLGSDSELHLRDHAEVEASFEREPRATVKQHLVSKWSGLVDNLSSLVLRVRAAAVDEAAPWDGSLVWTDTREGIYRPALFPGLRRELATAISEYNAKMPGNPQLPACTQLATSAGFRLSNDVAAAAATALEELARERRAIEAAAAAELG